MHDSKVEHSESTSELCITIDTIETTPSGIVKVTTPTGSIFLLRQFYLEHSRVEDFYVGKVFTENDLAALDLLESTLCLVVENAAMNYLNRSEHSRFLLEQKLRKKQYGKEEIRRALDYLESENLLSDSRYALAWLRTRRITKSEGRTKLLGELMSRGIDKNTANEALEEFYSEFSEEEMLEKAMYSLQKKGFSGDELYSALIKKGFSPKTIKKKW